MKITIEKNNIKEEYQSTRIWIWYIASETNGFCGIITGYHLKDGFKKRHNIKDNDVIIGDSYPIGYICGNIYSYVDFKENFIMSSLFKSEFYDMYLKVYKAL